MNARCFCYFTQPVFSYHSWIRLDVALKLRPNVIGMYHSESDQSIQSVESTIVARYFYPMSILTRFENFYQGTENHCESACSFSRAKFYDQYHIVSRFYCNIFFFFSYTVHSSFFFFCPLLRSRPAFNSHDIALVRGHACFWVEIFLYDSLRNQHWHCPNWGTRLGIPCT